MRFKRKPDPLFTGNCPVRQHTADDHYIGRCYHSTYDGRCHLHGDISAFLSPDADLASADDRLIERTSYPTQKVSWWR